VRVPRGIGSVALSPLPNDSAGVRRACNNSTVDSESSAPHSARPLPVPDESVHAADLLVVVAPFYRRRRERVYRQPEPSDVLWREDCI
jgi:hypothetical protein